MRLKCRAMVQETRRSNMEHLIVRPIELRRAHADKRVLQNLLRKGICVFKLLQIYAEARIHVVDDDVRRAGQLRVGAGEGQQLGGVGL